MNSPRKAPSPRQRWLVLWTLLPFPLASAQSTGGAAPAGAATDVVQLSPFTVSTEKDEGYHSRHTVSGNRINAPLVDLPQPITVYNEQFLLDTGVLDSESLADYFVGAQTNGGEANEGRMTIRGFDGAETQQMINGFMMTRTAKDNFNVERVEMAMGPSSVTYGNAQPGGQINTSTKQAVFGRTFGRVSQQFGSWDFSRSTLDLNTSRGRVAVRFNAVYQDNDSWQDWQTINKQDFALASSIHLGAATVLRLEGEYAERNETRTDNYLGFREPHLWAQAFIDETIVPRSKSGGWQGPDARTQVRTKYGSAIFEHRINSHWAIEAGFALQRSDTGQANPTSSNQLRQDARTGYFVRTNWMSSSNRRPLEEYRISSMYELDAGWTRQKLLLQYGNLTETVKTAQAREYVKGSRNTMFQRTLPLALGNGREQTGYRPDPTAEWRWQQSRWLESRTDMITAAALGYYFGGRLTSQAGVRYTAFENRNFLTAHAGGLHTFRKGVPFVWDDSPETYTITGIEKLSFNDWSPTAGVVFKATRHVGLFANYSTSFARQQSNRFTVDGRVLDPERGIGYEVGVRVGLLDDRLNVSVSVFDLTKENISERVPDRALPPELIGSGAYWEPGITGKSEGYEVQLVGNPVPGWTIRGGFGYLDAYRSASRYTPETIGQPLEGLVNHSGNVYTVYDFSRGPLKGFRLGGGAVYKDKVLPDPEIKWENPSAVLVNAFLGYRRRWEKISWDVQVNVNNVTDEVYLNRFRFVDPRNFSVTNRISF